MRSFCKTLSLRSVLFSGLLATVAWPLTAEAVSRYVGVPGINSGRCRNAAIPCATVAYAVSQANSNDTIFIRSIPVPGFAFSEHDISVNQDLNFVGTGSSRVTITAQGNGRHFAIGANAFVRMSNLELVGGVASAGGSINNAGRLTMLNCRLSENQTTGHGGAILNNGELVVSASEIDGNTAGLNGGGIHNDEGAELTITNNSSIVNNSARFGGGIFTTGSSVFAKITSDTTVSGNTAAFDGGGVYAEQGSTLQIFTPSTFDGNSAGRDGGAVFHSGDDLFVGDIDFDGNSAGNNGGAISHIGSGRLTISRNTFTNNSAAQGGALFNATALTNPTTITQSTFENNSASNGGGAVLTSNGAVNVDVSRFVTNQGGSPGGGAIASTGDGSYAITHSSFESNSADLGGAIYDGSNATAGPSSISGSTFVSNGATFWGGAIFYIGRAGMQVVNSTFSQNTANDEGGAFSAGSTNGSITIANSTFYGNAAPNGATIYTQQPLTMNNNIVTHSEDPDTVPLNDGTACAGTTFPLAGHGNLIGTDPFFDGSCGPFLTFAGAGVIGLNLVLSDNGPTVGVDDDKLQTHILLAGSSAAGTAWNNCPDPAGNPLTVDQIDQPRPGGGDGCDVGAFELQ